MRWTGADVIRSAPAETGRERPRAPQICGAPDLYCEHLSPRLPALAQLHCRGVKHLPRNDGAICWGLLLSVSAPKPFHWRALLTFVDLHNIYWVAARISVRTFQSLGRFFPADSVWAHCRTTTNLASSCPYSLIQCDGGLRSAATVFTLLWDVSCTLETA